MSALITMGLMPLQIGVAPVPLTRGRQYSNETGLLSKSRLSTDSLGNFTLTLQGLVVGSSVQIETQAGALIEFRVADATSEVFSIPAYAAGNAGNDLRIKVRKGTTAPYYRAYETLTTAIVGSASIFIAQIPD